MPTLRIDIVTLFPEVFEPFLSTSIPRIAAEKGAVLYHVHDLRAWSRDKHRKVDDVPYGGGPGMVVKPEPVFEAVEAIRGETAEDAELILLTPQGEPYRQETARELAAASGLILLCGHYEGFDERVRLGLSPREVSLGDYVLSGGEAAAMVIVDTTVRLLPGVLGDEASAEHESFEGGTLDFPHYTRPRTYRGMEVPDVLLSGNHAEIAAWRARQARERTRRRRPDLLGENGEESG